MYCIPQLLLSQQTVCKSFFSSTTSYRADRHSQHPIDTETLMSDGSGVHNKALQRTGDASAVVSDA